MIIKTSLQQSRIKMLLKEIFRLLFWNGLQPVGVAKQDLRIAMADDLPGVARAHCKYV